MTDVDAGKNLAQLQAVSDRLLDTGPGQPQGGPGCSGTGHAHLVPQGFKTRCHRGSQGIEAVKQAQAALNLEQQGIARVNADGRCELARPAGQLAEHASFEQHVAGFEHQLRRQRQG
jgi:hypothetical protein